VSQDNNGKLARLKALKVTLADKLETDEKLNVWDVEWITASRTKNAKNRRPDQTRCGLDPAG
jgi:hypothetical protein